MRKPDFLRLAYVRAQPIFSYLPYLNIFQLRILWKFVKCLHYPEYRHNDIHGTVSLLPQVVQLFHRGVKVAFVTRSDDRLNSNRVGLVADLEHVVT
jgi:hypothetical protein